MRLRVEEDPKLQALLRAQDTAFREHRRALVELRRLYATSDAPNIAQAAHLQHLAHEAELRLIDANKALSQFAWEIVPFNKNPEHLDTIKQLRESAYQRIRKTAPPVEQKGPVVIITTINGVKKRFIE